MNESRLYWQSFSRLFHWIMTMTSVEAAEKRPADNQATSHGRYNCTQRKTKWSFQNLNSATEIKKSLILLLNKLGITRRSTYSSIFFKGTFWKKFLRPLALIWDPAVHHLWLNAWFGRDNIVSLCDVINIGRLVFFVVTLMANTEYFIAPLISLQKIKRPLLNTLHYKSYIIRRHIIM